MSGTLSIFGQPGIGQQLANNWRPVAFPQAPKERRGALPLWSLQNRSRSTLVRVLFAPCIAKCPNRTGPVSGQSAHSDLRIGDASGDNPCRTRLSGVLSRVLRRAGRSGYSGIPWAAPNPPFRSTSVSRHVSFPLTWRPKCPPCPCPAVARASMCNVFIV
jgi:hypothetical protein